MKLTMFLTAYQQVLFTCSSSFQVYVRTEMFMNLPRNHYSRNLISREFPKTRNMEFGILYHEEIRDSATTKKKKNMNPK